MCHSTQDLGFYLDAVLERNFLLQYLYMRETALQGKGREGERGGERGRGGRGLKQGR